MKNDKYNSCRENEKRFEEFDNFLGSLISKYDIEEEDFARLSEYSMDHLYKENLLKIIEVLFEKNKKDLMKIEAMAYSITEKYLNKIIEKAEEDIKKDLEEFEKTKEFLDNFFAEYNEEYNCKTYNTPSFENIPAINGREGEF